MLSTTNNIDLAYILAIIIFCIAGILHFKARNFGGVLIAFGLAMFVLAFVINP